MEKETKQRKMRVHDHVGLLANACMDFRRAIEANGPKLGHYLKPEHLERLSRLAEELKAAGKASLGLLAGFEGQLGALAEAERMKARIAELERENEAMALKLSVSGHSDAIPSSRKGGGSKAKGPPTGIELAAV